MSYHSTNKPLFFLGIVIECLVVACSNSEYTEAAGWDDIIVSQETNGSADSSKLDYLPIDDTEYPYAGIPRVVIATENYQKIKDCETEIPAKLQIWGEKTPESEVMDLTIRGRGNTSWTDMPKKSYKIEFADKQAMLGMPKDRDWALIANYADKTLMKNYITYKLSSWLNANYSPRCEFVELFLNKEYLGVYLLVETLKVNKHRIDINENISYVAEFDIHYKSKNTVIFLDVFQKPISIHHPKAATIPAQSILKKHLDSLTQLIIGSNIPIDSLEKWIDLQSYFLFYWIQEFSENRDGNFDTSVFFTWAPGEPLKMGPIWDFDLAYNGHPNTLTQDPQKWFIRNYYWNGSLFKSSSFEKEAFSYWKNNHTSFIQLLDSIDVYREILTFPAQNNFKKWPILGDTYSRYHQHSYDSHFAAVDALKKWIKTRITWIDSQI